MGGKTATSTQAVSIPPSVLAQYNSVNAQAASTAATPFQQYGGEFVSPVNSTQQSGIDATTAAANQAQPGYTTAQQTLGTAQNNTTGVNNAALGLAGASAGAVNPSNLDANSINKYMSPYLSSVLGSTAGLLNQNNQQQQSGQLGSAIQSGAFGGDRTGIAAANLEQQQNLSNANIYSGIANQGYQSALSTAQQQQGVGLAAGQANRTALANAGQEIAGIGQTQYGEAANTASEQGSLASGAQTAALQGSQAEIAAGTVAQQTQQAQDTAEYNQFQQQQSYPFQVDQFLANIAEGTGALSGSTTTTQQPGGFFSDVRLKHDIKKIGETFDGQEIYSYKMHGDDRTHIGLIAQQVEKKHPKAVGVDPGSHYKMVDYGRATEDAANRGHFYSGGVVPMRRVARAAGGPSIVSAGDLNAILQAQQHMYAPHSTSSGVYGGEGGAVPRGGSSRVPPPSGAVSQLVTAQGGLKPQPSALQNASAMGEIGKKANDMWRSRGVKPGKVTEETEPGTMARGGVAGARMGYDSGGDVDFTPLVAAHGNMYGPDDRKQRDIPSGGSGSHQLAVASGSPTPAPSGSSNLNTTLGVAQKGYQAYKKFNAPKTGVNGGGQSADLTTNSAISGSAPAADSSTVSGIASTTDAAEAAEAAEAAAPAAEGAAAAAEAAPAAEAAGTAVAAGGGEAAAAEAAAALAAEYGIVEAAPLLIAAKRGGRIKRDIGGGVPYEEGGSQLDIPNDANSAKLQTAGPIKKQPTGLQTLMTLGTEQGASGALGSMFSNQGIGSARGGAINRKGYDDGGDVDAVDDPDLIPNGVARGKIDRSGSGLMYTRDAGSQIPYAAPPLKSKAEAVDPEVASYTAGNYGPLADHNFTSPTTNLGGTGPKDVGAAIINPRTWDSDKPPAAGLGSADMNAGPPTPTRTNEPVKVDKSVDLQNPTVDDPGAPSKANKPSWWENVKGVLKDSGLTKSENLIPLLTGIAAMGTAPTRSLGVALASGLGAGTAAYLPTQEKQADIAQTKANTKLTGVQTQGTQVHNLAQLQAQYALQGLALFPDQNGQVLGPDGQRYSARPKADAMAPATGGAPAGTPQYLGPAGAAAATSAGRNYSMLPPEVQQESNKKIGDVYQAGSEAQEGMLHTQHWEQVMASNKGVLDNGSYSELRAKAVNMWNTAMDAAGMPKAKLDGLADAQMAQKMSIGAAAAGENANQQRSFGALKAFLAATPNTDMARQASIPLIADLHVQQQQAIDKKNYYHELDENKDVKMPQYYSANDAQQAFDKDHPATNYEGERNKLSAVMQSPRYAPVMSVLQNGTPEQKKKMIHDIDAAFGPNFHRYFTGS